MLITEHKRLHRPNRDTSTQSQHIDSITIHRLSHNTSTQLQYIDSITTHRLSHNTSTQLQYIDTITIHRLNYNTSTQSQHIDSITIHRLSHHQRHFRILVESELIRLCYIFNLILSFRVVKSIRNNEGNVDTKFTYI